MHCYHPFQASFLTNNKITIILSITCVFNDITLFLYFFCCELQFLVNEWFLVYHLYIDFCCRYSLTINLIKDQSQQHGKAKESATSTPKCFDVKTDWLWMDNYKKKLIYNLGRTSYCVWKYWIPCSPLRNV